MNGAFWPVIGTLGDRPVRPGCQSIPKCISRVPGRARTGPYASAPRAVPRFAGAPSHSHLMRPAMCAQRSAGRVHRGLGRASAKHARAPSRAYAANEISRLPIGRARYLWAPIRDAGARARLPVCAWSLKGRSSRAGVCVRASAYEGARLRTRVPHACAQSCSRPRAHRPMRSRAGARRTPRKGAPNRM